MCKQVFVNSLFISLMAHKLNLYYAPNFEEVEEAYWFGPVRPFVRASVRYTCTRSRTVRDRILKFGMWVEYEN